MERDPLEVIAAAGDAIVPLYATLAEVQGITIESARSAPAYRDIERIRRGRATFAKAGDIVAAIRRLRARHESARHKQHLESFLRQHAPWGELRS